MDMLKKLFSMEGKVVIVTGGAQGIGKVVAEHIAAVGGEIVIFDLQEEKAKKTADFIAETYHCRAIAIGVNVTNPEDVDRAIAEADAKMGKLDLLFNNAGICLHKPALDVLPQEWLNVVNVNLNGIYFVARAFGKYLIDHDKTGSIVNTASMSGTVVNVPQEQASYNASKAGVIQLTKSLAVEWCGKGVRVNCISPGYMATELCVVSKEWMDQWMYMSPYKRMGNPSELAGAVIYLLSDSASFTSGCNLIVDGCYSVV